MPDDIDIDALLESSYKKKNSENKSDRNKRLSHRERNHRPSDSADSSSDSRDRRRSRHRRRSRSGDRRRRASNSSTEVRHRRSDSRDRHRRSRRRKSSSTDHHRDRHGSSRKRERDDNMVPRAEMVELTTEERDARTVFLMQLQRGVTAQDIADFFKEVGRVRDVRMISDKNSRRPKGISYVEFENIDSVTLALKMTGHILKGGPVIINPTMSEKNRTAMEAAVQAKKSAPPKLFIGSLNPNITEQMLRAMFEPFGAVTNVTLQYDDNGKSRGQGHIMFRELECAEDAMSKLNGFEVAGLPMKIWMNQDRLTNELLSSSAAAGGGSSTAENLDQSKMLVNSASRNEVMQKLASSRGLTSGSATTAASSSGSSIAVRTSTGKIIEPPVSGPSQCVVFTNMFDYKKDHANLPLLKDIETDVYKKVSAISQVLHVHVDIDSVKGNVYTKFKSIEGASKVIEKLDGIKYSGRTIKAFNVTLHQYSLIFPDL